MHSELILSFAKKVVNTNLDILTLWGATNLQIAINWQYYKPIFDFRLQNCHFGVFWPQKALNWRFLGQKSPKKKYGSKCLELSNSARNAKIAKNCQKAPKASVNGQKAVLNLG